MDEQSIPPHFDSNRRGWYGCACLLWLKTIHTRNCIGIDRSPPKIVDEGTLPDRQARPKTSISDSLYDGVVQVSPGARGHPSDSRGW